MPSDGNPGKIPGASSLQGSQATVQYKRPSGGNSLPQGGKGTSASPARDPGKSAAPATAKAVSQAPKAAPAPAAARSTDPQSLVDLLNAHLNDSGRPDQFRLDPASAGRLIQQVNPANGEVIGEFSIDEFPALARSIGASGLIVDSLA